MALFEELVHSYAPTEEDLKFLSEVQGVQYAIDSGFTVVDGEATRDDMPGIVYVLNKTEDNRWYWERGRHRR